MKRIVKLFNIFMLLMVAAIISSCNTTIDGNKLVENLTIITVNDFHGALAEDENNKYGAAKLAASINKTAENAEAAVILSAGDMFQGTALSNYDKGATVIEVMNEMNFDSMVLGNHEFDWGLSETLKYVDGNKNNGEANFPMLGCNVIEKATGKRPEGVDAYNVIERGGLKIGVVGWIDANAESDIAEAMIKDYDFAPALNYIKTAVKQLRTQEDADVVIAVGHQGNGINYDIASLEGDEKVDAIVNGHDHASYYGTIKRNDGVEVPYVQAGTAGEVYGVMTLSIDQNTKESTGGTAIYKRNSGSDKDSDVAKIVDELEELTMPVFGRIIGTATVDVNRNYGTYWAATALWKYSECDIAFINTGGIRSQAFPINAGSSITVSMIHTMMPFDNTLKTVDLKGSVIRNLVSSDLVYSNNVTKNGDMITINGEILDDEKIYSVATIDYVFDKPTYPFLKGENIHATGILFRDILIDRVEKDKTIVY